MWDRRHETGNTKHEMCDMRQETGTGDVRHETGDVRQEM